MTLNDIRVVLDSYRRFAGARTSLRIEQFVAGFGHLRTVLQALDHLAAMTVRLSAIEP